MFPGYREGVVELKVFDSNNRESGGWTKAYLQLAENSFEFFEYSQKLEEERAEIRQERIQELKDAVRAARKMLGSGSESERIIGDDSETNQATESFGLEHSTSLAQDHTLEEADDLSFSDSTLSLETEGKKHRADKDNRRKDSSVDKSRAKKHVVVSDGQKGEHKTTDAGETSPHATEKSEKPDKTLEAKPRRKKSNHPSDAKVAKNASSEKVDATDDGTLRSPKKNDATSEGEPIETPLIAEPDPLSKDEIKARRGSYGHKPKSSSSKGDGKKDDSSARRPRKPSSRTLSADFTLDERAEDTNSTEQTKAHKEPHHRSRTESRAESRAESHSHGDKIDDLSKSSDRNDHSSGSTQSDKISINMDKVPPAPTDKVPPPPTDKVTSSASGSSERRDTGSLGGDGTKGRRPLIKKLSVRETPAEKETRRSGIATPPTTRVEGPAGTPPRATPAGILPLDLLSSIRNAGGSPSARGSPKGDDREPYNRNETSPREKDNKRLSFMFQKKPFDDDPESPHNPKESRKSFLFLGRGGKEDEESSVVENFNHHAIIGFPASSCAVFKVSYRFGKTPLAMALKDGRECLVLQINSHKELAFCSLSDEMTTDDWCFALGARQRERGTLARLGARVGKTGKSILSFTVFEDTEESFDFNSYLDETTKKPKDPVWVIHETPEAAYAPTIPKTKWKQPKAKEIPAEAPEEEDDITVLGLVKKSPAEILPNLVVPAVIPAEDRASQESKDKYLQRKHLAMEILHTERSYVNAMAGAWKFYHTPLSTELEGENAKNALLDKNQIDQIFNFGNFELIYKFNIKFLEEIEKVLKDWTDESQIGPLFEKVAPDLALYTTYAQKYSDAVGLFHKLVEKDDRIRAKFDELRMGNGIAPLSDILIMPIQRIPRYSLLVLGLCNNTHFSHPDFLPLKTSLFAIMEVADNINEDVRRNEHNRKVSYLAEKGIKMDRLTKGGRYLMKEGSVKVQVQSTLMKKDQEQLEHFILFNDVFVRVKKSEASGSDLSQAKFCWPLALVWITLTDRADGSCQVELKGPNEQITFSDQDHWGMALTEMLNSYIEKRGKVKYEQHALVLNGHRFGSFDYPKQGWYKGEFVSGKRHGRGLWKFNGNTYSGFWSDDIMCGLGKMVYSNGDTYTGKWKGGAQHGHGTLLRADGSYCVGRWHHGQRDGTMKLHYANGDSYTGEWKGDLMHGPGTMHCTYGMDYVGHFEGGRFHGVGKLKLTGGYTYVGEFVRGTRSGWSKITYANGATYVGKIEDELRHGIGLGVDSDGSMYDGSWIRDKPEGKGTKKFQDGRIFTGDWLNGYRHGNGSMVYPNGSFYVGQWDLGQRHGVGFYKDVDGSEYVGQWANDEKEFKGIHTFPNGARYSGQFWNGQYNKQGEWVGGPKDHIKSYTGDFAEGLFNGKGEILFSNGDRYKGGFKDGLLHGNGCFEFANGTIHKGSWQHGIKYGKLGVSFSQKKTNNRDSIQRDGDESSSFQKDRSSVMSSPTDEETGNDEDGEETVGQTKTKSSTKPTDENPEETVIGQSYWKREGVVAGNLLTPSFGFPLHVTPTITYVQITAIDATEITKCW